MLRNNRRGAARGQYKREAYKIVIARLKNMRNSGLMRSIYNIINYREVVVHGIAHIAFFFNGLLRMSVC